MDLISHLPVDVKERILECLPTRDAARTTLLSSHWKDVWSWHGRLVFDPDFFCYIRKCQVKIITNILLHRTAQVKKFTLHIYSDPKPEQSDLDNWLLYLSKNGIEELNISIFVSDHKYKLPSYILLCQTIKQLILCGFVFDCPIKAHCIFPCVTSLVFKGVEFKDNVNGIVYTIPNLEKLVLDGCKGISNFKISAPKLESLSAIGLIYEVESRWLAVHLKAIKTLCLSAYFFSWDNVEVGALTFPIAINLQVIKLYYLCFASEKQFIGVMHLLQKSPNLCKLEITGFTASNMTSFLHEKGTPLRLFEDPDHCIFNQDLKMLRSIEIESFGGSRVEMLLFVKILLSKSPALQRVAIRESKEVNASLAIKISRELLRFPRASTKAQFMCLDRSGKPTYSLVT